MRSRVLIVVLIVTIMAVFTISMAEAGDYQRSGKNELTSNKMCLETKFNKTATRILNKKQELALTRDQASQIRALVADVQKRVIMQDAELKTLTVEVNTLMWEAPFNTEQVAPLIDRKHDLQKDKDHFLVASITRLYSFLRPEQIDILNML